MKKLLFSTPAAAAETAREKLLRVRCLLPVSQPPIEDAAVLVRGNRIVRLGTARELGKNFSGESFDLGEMILLPGLVNAHCHLDYTDVAGKIPPVKFFTDWIKTLMQFKAGWNFSEYAQSWLAGAKMLVHTGTTTVADVEAVPELLPHVWTATPLRVCSFLEMTGVKSRRAADLLLNETEEFISGLPPARSFAGLSPHALYSTTPELMRKAAKLCARRDWQMTTHVAESEQEFEMFMHGRGSLFEWLSGQRDLSDCGEGSPVQQLEKLGMLSRNLLAVHVNYLGDGDAGLLAHRNVSVAHCPRSHAYFRHRPFPFEELSKARVNIGLGTDSLASISRARTQPVELNMFGEMQLFASNHPGVLPTSILQMATLHGARALGLEGKIGELTPGAFADMIAIPFNGKLSDVFAAVLHHKGNVTASMIDGEWAMEAGSDQIKVPPLPPLRQEP